MRYIKGFLVGGIALFLVTVLYVVVQLLLLRSALGRLEPGSHAEIGLDLHAVITRDPIYWLVAVTAFAACFYWAVRNT